MNRSLFQRRNLRWEGRCFMDKPLVSKEERERLGLVERLFLEELLVVFVAACASQCPAARGAELAVVLLWVFSLMVGILF